MISIVKTQKYVEKPAKDNVNSFQVTKSGDTQTHSNEPQGSQGPQQNASGPSRNGAKPIQCFRCGERGHYSRQCTIHLNYMGENQTGKLPPEQQAIYM